MCVIVAWGIHEEPTQFIVFAPFDTVGIGFVSLSTIPGATGVSEATGVASYVTVVSEQTSVTGFEPAL